MKPAAFAYSRPTDLAEACALLAADDGARVIAGGQTLVPLMAMRLARPTRLIDIARLIELSYIRDDGDAVAIGATTTQRIVEASATVRARLPLLARAITWVGHAATRARGTVGGSLANADPSAEIGLVAATLGATLSFRDGETTTEIAAEDFHLGPMVTVLPITAILTGVRFPVWPERRTGIGFHEMSSRRSDFAFASAAAQIALDEDGQCRRLVIGIGGATEFPIRLDQVAAALTGTRPTADTVRAAVDAALADIVTMADLHASADYRRRVAASLAARAILDALDQAGGRDGD